MAGENSPESLLYKVKVRKWSWRENQHSSSWKNLEWKNLCSELGMVKCYVSHREFWMASKWKYSELTFLKQICFVSFRLKMSCWVFDWRTKVKQHFKSKGKALSGCFPWENQTLSSELMCSPWGMPIPIQLVCGETFPRLNFSQLHQTAVQRTSLSEGQVGEFPG